MSSATLPVSHTTEKTGRAEERRDVVSEEAGGTTTECTSNGMACTNRVGL